MRTVGIGVLIGSVGFGAFALRTPPDSPGSHPLPSATAEYSTRPSKSRYLPWFGSREVPVVPQPELDKTEWLPAVVRVVDLQSNPVAGATVEVRLDARSHALANVSAEEFDELVAAEEAGAVRIVEQAMIVVDRGTTDRDGNFRTMVEPNIAASAIVRDQDAQEGVSASFVAVPGAEEAPVITVEIAPLAVLAGRLEDGDGNPIPDADLTVTLRGSYALQNDVIDAPEGIRSAKDGSFRVPVRGGGALDLAISAGGFQPLQLAAVQVLPGHETRRDLTMERAALITGRFRDENGNPVAGRVELHALEEVPATSTYRHVGVQPDGSFAVGDIAPSRYRIVAYGDGFPPVLVDSVQAGGDPLAIRFEAGGRVQGEIVIPVASIRRLLPLTDEGVSPYAWAMVSISPEPTETAAYYGLPLPSVQVQIDGDGRGSFELSPVPVGRWILHAQVMNIATIDRAIDVRREGGISHAIVFDDGAASIVTGTVRSGRGAVSGGSVYLQSQGAAASVSGTVAEGGKFELPWVAPGKYTLSVTAYLDGVYESASREVEVSSRTEYVDVETEAQAVVASIPVVGEEEYFEPYLPDVDIEWSGETTIVGATAVIDGVRVWAGDRVTSVDGMLADSSGSAMSRLQGKEGTICRITLERPATGERLSFDLPRTRPMPRYGCRAGRGDHWDW